MKKKFAASIVAFALAMAMPTAAFAAGSVQAETVINSNGTQAQRLDTDASTDGKVQQITVTGNATNVKATSFGTDYAGNANTYATKKGEEAATKAIDKATEANQAKKDELAIKLDNARTPQQAAVIQGQIDAIDKAIAKAGEDAQNAWEKSAADYKKAVGSFANIDGNSVISSFNLEGDSTGGMTVSIVLDPSTYANHTVYAIILNDDGTITKTKCLVDANGCIEIQKNGFCVWTLVDCSGGLPEGTATEGVSASDFEKALSVAGNATDKGTSPKTGC